MKNYNLEAIVLKSTNYKDSDKLYTVLSKDQGVVTLYARGVRKISSKRAGNLDTLNHINAKVSQQDSGWKNVSEVSVLNSFKPIKSSLLVQSHAFYLLELAYRLIKDDESATELFDALLTSLKRLASTKGGVKAGLSSYLVINTFEVYLMRTLGYEMSLDKCVNCGREFGESWEHFKFSVNQGGFVCPACFTALSGTIITFPTAEVLYSIGSNFTYKPKKITQENIYASDDLLKLYIKTVLEDSFASARVFKKIREVL